MELASGYVALSRSAGFVTSSSSCHFPALVSSSFSGIFSHSSSSSSVRCRRNVVEILEQRGLVESIAGESLKKACDEKPIKVYCGFDPTAESLHLGNLLGIVVLEWFQRCGHETVALLGGATGRIGDPSGKSAERPVMDEATIEKNTQGIQALLTEILQQKAVVLNNYDWWKEFSLLEFLRDVGKFARVGTMVAKESVKRRLALEEGISFTEFTYQLLQGYDFVHLYKSNGVSVQIGGSDQWGNITAGIDLVRKLLQRDDAYGLTFPLLVKSDGTKFGKSEGGAVWLSSKFLSPYHFYQHLFATPDSDVIKMLRMLTFVELEEIEALEKSMSEPGYVANTAQRRLAEEVTRFVHGEDGLEEALKVTQALAPGSTTTLDWTAIEAISKDVPSCTLDSSIVVGPVVDLCVSCGLAPSKAVARRLIKQGGIYMNNAKVDDERLLVAESDIIDGKMLLLSAGKKNKMVVRIG
ncbi:hypothetical protein SELMODRAFT_111886 [Selaginella moellendorffii]|uniref:Tyrosine--tRNA ligase n=1 Tax=Selaginella moellendorffii TaxID=88036 RepID=D8S9Y2_SELML|nr:tyrosine--tRNA ligase, chloroplastic/mitochondrial isoform X1 [Selaginella moellendorffii]EFJ18906.1 hypothetical protein SELMODRAFT_111886 [Selaginella moellendorffii]|eukprot:XP_002980036.1 tyrosine--tRNA ligase, chloroplastic/mitochondrial isoform X1 [Selaginella moellendorffii]